mgnify:CR=1 FL=1
MKHKNDLSDITVSLQIVRIYGFVKDIKLYKRALYIVFLFVMSKNTNIVKEIKLVLRASLAF